LTREEEYLRARYACTALQVKLKRAGRLEEAEALASALEELCGELRGLLAGEGKERVSRPFPRRLLEHSVEWLAAECLEAARGLGSPAGRNLARAVEALSQGGKAGR